MSDQKNKQQQPQQGNKQSGQVPGQQPQQGNKQSGRVPGQQTPSSQPPQSGNMKNSKNSGDIEEGDIEHPDQQPDKKVTIDDNPDETQKKVPNMHNKH